MDYSLCDNSGIEIASGKAQTRIKDEYLSILPEFDEVLCISLRDIIDFSHGDYRIYLNLNSNEKLTLFNLGYKYEDFVRVFSKLRNEMILKDLLMHEALKKSGVKAEYIFLDDDGNEKHKGKCDLQLYETGLVIIPEKYDITRIPYSDLSQVKAEDYALSLTTEGGKKIIVSQMGGKFDSVKKTLSDIMNERSFMVRSLLKEMLPDVNPSALRQVARFMKDGKAARRSDVESISPELWKELETKLEVVGAKEEYNFLKSISQQEKLCIGMKRDLLGDLTGEYIWFLIPIYSTNPDESGNVVAMEAASGGGKATYFFRIVDREDYSNFKDIEALHTEVENFIKKINQCMLAINFRREPIYLPDEKLDEPRYQKYRFAIQKIPELRELRRLFIGRVTHFSSEQWEQDVMNLLRFNVSTLDNDVKWMKGDSYGQQ